MSADEPRTKLINAILFFVTNTRRCGKTKLFKLLFFLDFGIFRQTGRAVTGLEYSAWPKGPVPTDLFFELDNPPPDLASALKICELDPSDPTVRYRQTRFYALRDFDETAFTPRELDMMNRLAEVFRDATATHMVESTHLRTEPWHQVYQVEGRPKSPIPYRLALDGQEDAIDSEQADAIEQEDREIRLLLK